MFCFLVSFQNSQGGCELFNTLLTTTESQRGIAKKCNNILYNFKFKRLLDAVLKNIASEEWQHQNFFFLGGEKGHRGENVSEEAKTNCWKWPLFFWWWGGGRASNWFPQALFSCQHCTWGVCISIPRVPEKAGPEKYRQIWRHVKKCFNCHIVCLSLAKNRNDFY